MLATHHIQTIDSDRQRKIAKTIAGLLGTLSWIIAIIMAIVLFTIMIVPWVLPIWASVLTPVFTIIIGGFLIFLTEKYKRRYLEKAGYGIRTLEKLGAKTEGNVATLTLRNRKVVTDIIKTAELAPGGYTQHLVSAAYTRISVEHRGNMPCVIQASLEGKKSINLLDKEIYLQWKKP